MGWIKLQAICRLDHGYYYIAVVIRGVVISSQNVHLGKIPLSLDDFISNLMAENFIRNVYQTCSFGRISVFVLVFLKVCFILCWLVPIYVYRMSTNYNIRRNSSKNYENNVCVCV